MQDHLTRRGDAAPDECLNPHVETYCWHHHGWECASIGSVADARKLTRGQAAAFFANETTGYLPNVRVWKRYVRPLTRQNAWECDGRDAAIDRYSYDHDCEYEDAGAEVPEIVPRDYRPDGDTPVWEFVHRAHPEAIPVWVCGEKGTPAPHVPQKPVALVD